MELFKPADLIDFCSQALTAAGVGLADAELTARSLVQADQRGIHSHGLLRLPFYLRALEAGGINASPTLRWLKDSGPVGLLEADGALGQVSMAEAVDRAIIRTKEYGVAVISVQGSTHYGAGAFWSDQLAAEGFLAIITSTTGPVVSPYGGSGRVFGTNPLTMAAPSSDDHPLTADLATSNGAYGKIMAAKNEGLSIPDGWAVDQDGRPTVDPTEAMAGALLPFGGHKGSAIAAVLEAFAASLSGAAYSFETKSIWSNPASRMNTGHVIMSIDTAAFNARSFTEDKVARLQGKIRGSASPGGFAYAPGDPERRNERLANGGIALMESTTAELESLAETLGLSRLEAIQ